MDRDKRLRVDDLKTFGRSRAVRWAGYDYRSDAVIHVTICADQGSPFSDLSIARMVSDSVIRSCELRHYQLFGFCLMPDHLHVLLSPGNSNTVLGHWLSSFKSITAHEYVAQGGEPPLWQRSAHDHVCRNGETAETGMRYIVDNLVRRGLVTSWRDWPWTRVFIDM